jgi:hypothetical protein
MPPTGRLYALRASCRYAHAHMMADPNARYLSTVAESSMLRSKPGCDGTPVAQLSVTAQRDTIHRTDARMQDVLRFDKQCTWVREAVLRWLRNNMHRVARRLGLPLDTQLCTVCFATAIVHVSTSHFNVKFVTRAARQTDAQALFCTSTEGYASHDTWCTWSCKAMLWHASVKNILTTCLKKSLACKCT